MIKQRDKLYDAIKEELFGPLDPDAKEVLNDSPSNRYFCGVLYPNDVFADEVTEEPCDKKGDNIVRDVVEKGGTGLTSLYDLSDEQESDLNLSNAFKQSALSISVAASKEDTLNVTVHFALYEQEGYVYTRHPYTVSVISSVKEILKKGKEGDGFKKILHDENGALLFLSVFPRWHQADSIVFTVSLVNGSKGNSKAGFNKKTFFQTELIIENTSGFAPFYERTNVSDDSDLINNELLYRKVRCYAIGHGCSPLWSDRGNEAPKKIESSFLPNYELKAVIPSGKSDNLSMLLFSREEQKEKAFEILDAFCDGYEDWIKERALEGSQLDEHFKKAAEKNIQNCNYCLERMRKGVETLKTNQNAFTAFRLMNRAMLLQQIHSKIPADKQKLDVGEDGKPFLTPSDYQIPNPDSFTPEENKNYGHWRAFQLGFILLTINSMVDQTSKDREIIDLIWFPTGGGKTEAYLGLTAFTLLYNRITEKDKGDCVQVFMRYSLRLLTSQQYQRAASLVCALEHMRRLEFSNLGTVPFSIGLWVGQSSTPNTRSNALDELDELQKSAHETKGSKHIKNHFIITRCPWCGAEMGVSHKHKRVFGYTKTAGVGSKKRFVFCCDNPDCEFHSPSLKDNEKFSLPLEVVDEDIYENPPSILIGTVDKFAMIPFRGEDGRNLFGLADGSIAERSHPQLVIQDELHLITGPLGSAVACYETMFDALCSVSGDSLNRPKIVASTATVSQAASQCHCLFGVPEGDVCIFPSPCLDSNVTYFSDIDEEKPGRKYVGVYSPASSSPSTSSIHYLAGILASKKTINWEGDDNARDAYWTNVCYFNSIRELAQATTWENADVAEQEARIAKRKDPTKFFRLPTYLSMEMNSRNGDEDISTYLAQLNTEYQEKGNKALDLVYTTNMFSVGVDIDRLGLMTVFGQPKTSSEYIQATSRVGRKTDQRPGIVFTLYNPCRPRDKSIFEAFESFHSKLYASVEPMSVTPFSPHMRKKAIAALLVGIANGLCTDLDSIGNPSDLAKNGWFDKAKDIILSRVHEIDPDEENSTKRQIERILKTWIEDENLKICYYPWSKISSFGAMGSEPAPAIVPDNAIDSIPREWKGISIGVPTSMRSVDQTCKLTMFNNYGGEEDE